jgi:5S rRNA maturation endonuclease (ribonuclease M5)
VPFQLSFLATDAAAPHHATALTLHTARLAALVRELALLNREIPVIVEGVRDLRALRRLGLAGQIIRLHSGESVAAFGERMSCAHPAVILLLDWDRRGRQLHRRLAAHLESSWEPYHFIRQELMALCAAEISSVEELPTYLAARGTPVDPQP